MRLLLIISPPNRSPYQEAEPHGTDTQTRHVLPDPLLPKRPADRRIDRLHEVPDEARDLLKKREGAIADGVPITAKSTRLTFDDAVKDVINDYTINQKKSIEDLERRITLHLTPVFAGRTLSSITTGDARAFAARRLEAKASPAEIDRELAHLKRAFRLAVENGRVSRPGAKDPDAERERAEMSDSLTTP